MVEVWVTKVREYKLPYKTISYTINDVEPLSVRLKRPTSEGWGGKLRLFEAYSGAAYRPRRSAFGAFEGNTGFRGLQGLWIELQPQTICKPR